MSKFEDQFALLLKKECINYEREKTYQDLKHGYYRFDFWLKDMNILVEIEGPQHYEFNKLFHKNRKDFLKAKERDRRKNSYCLAHDIPLYRIPYWELDRLQRSDDIFQEQFHVTSQYHNDRIKIPKNLTK